MDCWGGDLLDARAPAAAVSAVADRICGSPSQLWSVMVDALRGAVRRHRLNNCRASRGRGAEADGAVLQVETDVEVGKGGEPEETAAGRGLA